MNSKDLINKCENELDSIFKDIDIECEKNSKKVIDAFHKYKMSESDLNGTIGYGYNDIGRDKIELIYADIFEAEKALVRNQFISASNALYIALSALLKSGDKMLCISGTPYDTLHEVIGIKENDMSLISNGIIYDEIDLIDDDFDYEKIKKSLDNIKMVYIQRSRGYSLRESLCIKKLEKVINLIHKYNKDIIIFVDNCYCEFVESKSPIEIGANICVGSLIKNLGAGIASNGAYVVGDEKLIDKCAQRLTLPGEGSAVGPSMNANRDFALGLYLAPSVVASALKVSILTSKVLESLGYKVAPRYNETRADIVELIYFNDKDKLIKYAKSIQRSGAIDSHVEPFPSPMPGYDDEIIMSSPSFTQGSSIELSCDGPIREPYVLFQQGSLTYEYGKLAIINAIDSINE